MKFFLLFFFMTIVTTSICLSQNTVESSEVNGRKSKPLIESNLYESWPNIEWVKLTDNGKYLSYFVDNQPNSNRVLVLQATDFNWRMEFHNIDDIVFTNNGRNAVLSNSECIYIVKLGLGVVDSIWGSGTFKIPKNGNGEVIAYRKGKDGDSLVVRNLVDNRSLYFQSVKDYYFGDNSTDMIVLLKDTLSDIGPIQNLELINMSNGESLVFWRGRSCKRVIFSKDGTRMAFMASHDGSEEKKYGVWCYKIGTSKAFCILDTIKKGDRPLSEDLELDAINFFTNDNQRIFITLGTKSHQAETIDGSLPDIWNFNDKKLQSQQLNENGRRFYTAIINISDRSFFRLEERDEFAWIFNHNPAIDSLAIVVHQESDGRSGEDNWNPACKQTMYLVSTKTGKRESFVSVPESYGPTMSAFGKYIIYYDSVDKNYFTYEIGSGVKRNITKKINSNWQRDFGKGIEGWIHNDSAVVIYDHNDIWLLDPAARFAPVNLTNGYGKRNDIMFFLTWSDGARDVVSLEKEMYLTAFNQRNKDNGFYSITIGKRKDPIMLTMESVVYDIPYNTTVPQGSSFKPVRAKNAKSFVVRKMSASQYPNLFYTSDFRSFRPITNFQPQKGYNWYYSELHSWKSFDSISLKGILYKPENFDSTRKYPVIFNYYESKSDGLNAFIMPEALTAGCVVNIPYYVSHGYLVFCPDIRYTIGNPMESTYSAILSGAEYLSSLPYIDSKKMGLQGCSWGGIQTNYLVSRTNLFAAACSASGMADWISGFNSLSAYGNSLQGMYQVGQFRMGGTIWDKQDLYIKNSPVLQAKNISTPILLMHTKDDGVCPFSNAVEFFTALRRLGKRSWMLVYPGDHGIYGKEALDFSIRMKQFFDHYLKGIAAPVWMTKGVSAKLKGTETGLGLDYTVKTPTPSLIIDTTYMSAKN